MIRGRKASRAIVDRFLEGLGRPVDIGDEVESADRLLRRLAKADRADVTPDFSAPLPSHFRFRFAGVAAVGAALMIAGWLYYRTPQSIPSYMGDSPIAFAS